MNLMNGIGRSLLAVACVGICAGPTLAADQEANPGVAKGETTQQKSQQGIGLEAGSSNVILGGPETITGKIDQVQGDEYSIQGDRGQLIKLRLTKDSNIVCAGGEGAKMSTGRQGAKEEKEIPISPATEEQMKSHDSSRAEQQLGALNDPNRQQAEHQMPELSKDPSKLKDVVGSTDQAANKDMARGSGFVVGGAGGCQFKAGDRVKVEASDTGTITTIKALSEQEPSGSAIAGRGQDQQ